MKVFVTGATDVLGTFAVRALLAAGHDVTGLASSPEKAAAVEALGATAEIVGLFDADALSASLTGYDAVCNLATHVPVEAAAWRPGAWRVHDRLRAEGSRVLAAAARAAGVGRVLQESACLLYADAGADWITETSPLAVSRVIESAAVAEANASGFAVDPADLAAAAGAFGSAAGPAAAAGPGAPAGPSAVGAAAGGAGSGDTVILRFGAFLAEELVQRRLVQSSLGGRLTRVPSPAAWISPVHPEDAGAAVAAALLAPAGIYNVCATPLMRSEVLTLLGPVASRPARRLPGLSVSLARERLELMTRSQRVSADKLAAATGWRPRHPVFATSWLTAASVSPRPAATQSGRADQIARAALPPAAARRRQVLDEIFGDVLPTVTQDEVEPGGRGRSDDDYRRDVPPHHG